MFADKTAIAYGDRRLSYSEFGAEATRLAHALRASGVERGDRVAYMCPNIPEMLVANFGVPLAGAVLVPINTRLSAEEVALHLRSLRRDAARRRHRVSAGAGSGAGQPAERPRRSWRSAIRSDPPPAAAEHAHISYDEFMKRGSGEPLPWTVDDELGLISINYSSGTTGQPKGAMYTHRGAYLNAIGEIIHQRFDPESVYLWTLPMFHCNGWCTPWAVTGIGATHVCLRAVRADVIWRLLDEERVTHLDGAPTVLVTIAEAPQAHPLERELVATVAGAAPSPTVIARMRELGARIVHVYGMTELYGPYTLNEWQAGWSAHPAGGSGAPAGASGRRDDPGRSGAGGRRADERCSARRSDDGRDRDARQQRDGRATTTTRSPPRRPSRAGGCTPEISASSTRTVMSSCATGPRTSSSRAGRTYRRSRSSTRSSRTTTVLEVAVIGVPDEKWGERPKAFVLRRPGAEVNQAELIGYLQTHIARFKVPKAIEFVDQLPRTSTGKIQKFELREKEWAGHTSRIQG